MRTNAFYIRALLAVVAFTALMIALFGRSGGTHGDVWQASSFNASARGHKAFYTTLEELHWPVARWQSIYHDLNGTGQVMILARNRTGWRENLQRTEIDQLLRWVTAGNRLILFGDYADSADADPLLKALNVPIAAPFSTGDRLYEQGTEFLAREREAVEVTSLLPSVEDRRVILERCLPLPAPPANATVLLRAAGMPFAYAIPHGNGSVTFVSSASLLDNHFLPQADNLTFVTALLRGTGPMPGRIWFEEAHHGYRTAAPLRDWLKHPGVRLAGGQILLGLLVFLSGQLVRFGPVRPLQRERGRSTLEFVNSLASLYRRANLRDDVVEALFHETHQRILRRLNLPENTSHELIARLLAEAYPHLPRWKKLAQRFDSHDYVQGLPPSGWLKVSRELILIKNAMSS